METARGARRKIAIVGGGIAGVSAAHRLAAADAVDVTLFDWGRAVGGRASHRHRPEVCADGSTSSFTFDHGAQFFHANHAVFRSLALPHATHWPAEPSRLALLTKGGGAPVPLAESTRTGGLFFGLGNPKLGAVRFVARGGMGALARGILAAAQASAGGGTLHVREGSRVASCECLPDGRWQLRGDGLGHEQSTSSALAASRAESLGVFDELLVTDHMAAAMPDWHPCCLRGLATALPRTSAALRAALRWDEGERRFLNIRPLFTCMVAFAREPGDDTTDAPFDAAAIEGSDVLQWACAQDARPHLGEDSEGDTGGTNTGGGSAAAGEADRGTARRVHRWVLVSTPEFAARCLGGEGMSRPAGAGATRAMTSAAAASAGAAAAGLCAAAPAATVEYVPQTDEYLRSDPADAMVEEFERLLCEVSRKRDGISGSHAYEQGESKGQPAATALGDGGARSPSGARQLRKPLLAKCQRWGAAFCEATPASAPDALTGAFTAELVASLAEAERDRRVTFCGDFLVTLGAFDGVDGAPQETGGEEEGGGCGHPFAIQNASLSGVRAAERILARAGL